MTQNSNAQKNKINYDLVINLVRRDISLRYIGSYAGFIWSFCSPFVIYITYYIIFTEVIPSKIENFPLYLIVGIVHWVFFAQVASRSCTWLSHNAPLLQKIWFPRIVIPISGIMTILLFWISSLLILFILYIPLGGTIGFSVLAYPIFFAVYFLFVFGIGLCLSVFNARYKDIGHLVDVILPLFFWFTPIIWSEEMVENLTISHFLAFNPMSPFIECFRAILYRGVLPEMVDVIAILVLSGIAIGGGIFVFSRYVDDLVEHL